MNKQEIQQVVESYIKNENARYALLISGVWGCGKTFLYENYLADAISALEVGKNNRKTNIYISLYGMNSIEALSKQLLSNYLIYAKANGNDIVRKGVKAVSGILGAASRAFSFSAGAVSMDLEKLNELSTTIEVKDLVICFDDLERCSISISEVFGYINNLIEHCNCKVIILADEDNIGKTYANINVEQKYQTILTGGRKVIRDKPEDKTKRTDLATDELTMKELKQLNETLYSENYIYRDIKEKVIGKTCKYTPGIEESLKDLIMGNAKSKGYLEEGKYRQFLTEHMDKIVNAYHTENSEKINSMREQGMSIPEIMKATGLSKSSVHSYLPYTKIIYNVDELSLYAERCRMYRKRKQAVEQLQICKEASLECVEKYLWSTIEIFSGYSFTTVKGLRFRYAVNGNEIQINRKKKSITRSSVKVALKVTLEEKGNISGPKKLEVFGASYLYSMFLRFGLIDTERKLNGYLPDMDNI